MSRESEPFVSCQCPAKRGENCPLTADECAARETANRLAGLSENSQKTERSCSTPPADTPEGRAYWQGFAAGDLAARDALKVKS